MIEIISDHKPTNADRIRAMSDEELAKKFLFFAPTFVAHPAYRGLDGIYRSTPEEAIKNSLEWLQQPAE